MSTTDRLPLPTDVQTRDIRIQIRAASPVDLNAILALLEGDPVSASRGDFSDPIGRSSTRQAFADIATDPRNAVLVAESGGQIVGTMQLTLIPGLSRGGATRLQIEAVHVGQTWQSRGIGSAMMRWVMEVAAPACGVRLIQLTSDSRRQDAHRFYERLGFEASHIGFKYRVSDQE